MHYAGIAYAPENLKERFSRREVLPFSDIYIRSTPRFETSAPRYGWLNNIIAVGKRCAYAGRSPL